jgi:hypothetical protein
MQKPLYLSDTLPEKSLMVETMWEGSGGVVSS